MNIKSAAILCGAIVSFSSFADQELRPAPQEAITEAKQVCQTYAVEDSIAEQDLADYVLNCVNDELHEQGYQAIDSLE